MDKRWMDLPRSNSEYQKGLKYFLDFAFSKSKDGMILCPWKDCKNANDPPYSRLNDTENDPSHSTGTAEIKTRGPTNMARVYNRRKSIEVEFDDIEKPIGSNKSEYVEFIGTLVRNGSSLPLDFKDWHKVPSSVKRNLLEMTKEKFYGAPEFEEFTLLTFSKSWKTWKTRVKKKYFDPNSSLEENLRRRPDAEDERVQPDQWKNLVLYWSSDQAPKISAQNKDNRAHKNMMHLTGKRSFSQIRDYMKKEARATKEAQLRAGDDSHSEATRVPSSSSSHHQATSFRRSSSSMNKMPLRVGAKVSLRSVFDSSKIVAIGRLQSLDQSVRVGQNWCEVIISVAVECDEDLVRPNSYVKTIGDAIGENITWPQNLVYMEV